MEISAVVQPRYQAGSIEAEKMLAADGINAEIINIHTIKPLDRELVVKSALKTGKVVTVEEHAVIGGVGSAVCDVLCEEAPTKVLKIGINHVFGAAGPALELIKKYGLDAEGIYLSLIHIFIIPIAEETGTCYSYHRQWNFLSSVVACGNLTITDYGK